MIPELANTQTTASTVIDISYRFDDDFDELIPETSISSDEVELVKELEKHRAEKIGMDVLPEEVFNQILETCFQQGNYKGFRDALFFVTQANWGVRASDARIIKRIDFLNENNKFRESCLFSEIKTGKPRTMYINDAIKMCVLMVIWSKQFQSLDYLLIGSNYKKKIDTATGKVIKKDGHILYEYDCLGNKISEPLSYPQIRKILSDKLVDDLHIQLKNHKNCENGKVKYATHSLRKLYSCKVEQMFQELYGDMGQAHTAAMQFLNWNLNHSSLITTSRYCGDFETMKKTIDMKLNLGYKVIKKYYLIEREKYLATRSTMRSEA